MKYYLIAGEASGDLHGSNLMKGLYAEDPEADCRFWGGERMDAVFHAHQDGTGLVHDYRDGAVMGYIELIGKAGSLLGKLRRCKEDILAWRPDVVILIDYPGFNFRIAGFAHKKGFKVFYYIAPKVWASRENRIRKLKAHVDRLFIIFPFEKAYFDRKGVTYTYAGNPLVDAIDGSPALQESRADFLARTGLPDKPYIALLAGSRSGEIKTMMPKLRNFMQQFKSIPEYSDYQFVIAAAPARSEADYTPFLEGSDLPVSILFGETYAVLKHAEAAVINSGTASLEAALIGTPQVVCYGIAGNLSYCLGRLLLRTPFISLGNLILGRSAFRELIQVYFTPENVTAEIRRILEDRAYRARMLADYGEIRRELGGTGASAAVARAMVDALR